jgi:hypothetical protein
MARKPIAPPAKSQRRVLAEQADTILANGRHKRAPAPPMDTSLTPQQRVALAMGKLTPVAKSAPAPVDPPHRKRLAEKAIHAAVAKAAPKSTPAPIAPVVPKGRKALVAPAPAPVAPVSKGRKSLVAPPAPVTPEPVEVAPVKEAPLEPGTEECAIWISRWVDRRDAERWARYWQPQIGVPIRLVCKNGIQIPIDHGLIKAGVVTDAKGNVVPECAINAPWKAREQQQLAEAENKAGNLVTFPAKDKSAEVAKQTPAPAVPKPAMIVMAKPPGPRKPVEISDFGAWSPQVVTAKSPQAIDKGRAKAAKFAAADTALGLAMKAAVAKKAAAPTRAAPVKAPRKGEAPEGPTKTEQINALLSRPKGATLAEVQVITQWPAGKAYLQRRADIAKRELVAVGPVGDKRFKFK